MTGAAAGNEHSQLGAHLQQVAQGAQAGSRLAADLEPGKLDVAMTLMRVNRKR